MAITLDTYRHVLTAHDQTATDFIGRSLDEASRAGRQNSVTNL